MDKKEKYNKEIDPSIVNREVNPTRFLGKMLEEQKKKEIEIKSKNSNSNNPSRFSQTIKPKDTKINSVLINVKQQVLREENAKLSIQSQRRSPTEKDLHMNNNAHLPTLIEKEIYFKGIVKSNIPNSQDLLLKIQPDSSKNIVTNEKNTNLTEEEKKEKINSINFNLTLETQPNNKTVIL